MSVVSDSVRPHRRQPTRQDSPGKNTGVGCHFLLQCMKVKSESEVTQSCLTLSDPMDRSLPGSSIHGIFQARVLVWVAIAISDYELTRGYYSVIKTNEVQIHATTLGNVKNIILSEISQREKDKYSKISLTWNVYNAYWKECLSIFYLNEISRQIHRNRKIITGCQGCRNGNLSLKRVI